MTLLCKIIYLLNQGEQFSENEAVEMFFNVTKLFNCQDQKLRRLVYVFIKELKISESYVFIVTQSLQKDMNTSIDNFKANALRVLTRIVDNASLQTVDRQIKTSLVDKNNYVKQSALVSSLKLTKRYPDTIKKLVGEIQTILLSGNADLQYHSLLLLHEINKHDPRGILKVLSQLTASSSTVQNKLAKC